jgi:fumarate hydratase class II
LTLIALWGAQTQRALEHFAISTERIPHEVMLGLVLIKRAPRGSTPNSKIVERARPMQSPRPPMKS